MSNEVAVLDNVAPLGVHHGVLPPNGTTGS